MEGGRLLSPLRSNGQLPHYEKKEKGDFIFLKTRDKFFGKNGRKGAGRDGFRKTWR